MKALSSSTWLCLGLTFLCVLQSIHLNYISREPLRTTAPSQYPHQVDEHQTAASQQTPPQDIASLTTENENPLIDDTLLSDDPSNLFYFIQVSDLHISKFRSQTERFLHFVKSALPVVRPSFVVVTGDLTDAKDVGDIKTVQYEEEWMLYKNAIDQGTTNGQDGGLPWYDMRGNHDCFDMPSWESDVNLYRTFGKSAHLLEEGQGVYAWQMKQNYGNYRFVAMDACPKKGPARPLNFYGYVTTNTMDRLESTLLDETTYNHTFLFTHYPTTTMVFGQSSLGRTFQDILQQTSIYFCGHLHRLAFGLGDVLKSYHTATKSLELELGDMKDHGVYRIMAVDHDLVSFVDVELPLDVVQPTNGDPYRFPLVDNNTILWPDKVQLPPVILITNPKDGRYLMNEKEPTHRIRDSSHVRFLIFSAHEPSTLKVRVFVDNKHHPFPATYSGNKGNAASSPPLWTTPWSPEDFDDITTHSLRVEVTAPDGQVGESQIFFRVDGVRLMIGGGFGEWLIGTSVANIFKYTVVLGLAFMLLLLLGPKVYTDFKTMGQQQRQNGDDIYSKTDIPPSAHIMLSLHNLDANPYAGPYQCIERRALAWLLRFFQFPTMMPVVFYTTFLFTLSFLCLPWFHAEFIPSGDHLPDIGVDDRYGTFYLWGITFGNEWLPLGDTFMFATFHLAFDVGVFLVLFAWRATDSEDLYCPSTTDDNGTAILKSSHGQQWNRKVWFKVCEIIYWLWRMDSVMTLGAFYGGVWPTLMGNLLMWWMIFAAGVLIWGKNGLARYRSDQNKTRIQTTLNGCQHCRMLTTTNNTSLASETSPSLPPSHLPSHYNQHNPIQRDQPAPASVSATLSHDHTPLDDDLDFSESSVTSTSSSSSTANMDGIRYKGRRKGNNGQQ
ncbi:unnamed protein product [Absidia cylindrospora]